MTYLLHFIIGAVGAGCAWVGRSFCPHRKHQIMVSVALLAAEAVASVRLVG